MSGYMRDSQLRRQLEEKVKEATRARQAAEDGLKAAQDLIDSARKNDADVVEAQKPLAEATAAMSSKDYKLAAEKAAEASERGRRIYRDRVRAMIASSANLNTLARSTGADVSEAEGVLAKAQDALVAEDLPAAVDLAKKAWKRTEKTLSEHLSSSFSQVQALILSAKNLGRDVAPVEDLLSRARTAMEGNNFPSALEYTKEGLDTIKEDLGSALGAELREAEDLLHTAEGLGAEITKPTTLLERAKTDVGNLDYEKANNALRQCRTESDRALQKVLEGKFSDFSKFIEGAKALGADSAAAEDLFSKATAEIKKGNVRGGAKLVQQGLQAVQDAQFQRVVQTIGASREKFVAAVNLGVDLKEAISHLNSARQALQRSAFREALDWAAKADEVVERSVGRIRRIQERLKELHRAFAQAEATGVSVVPARRAAERAREAFQTRDLDTMEREIDAANEELRKAERERVMRSIESAQFILSMGEQNGVDLSAASKLLEAAIVATKANEHRRALDLVSQIQSTMEESLRKHIADRTSALRGTIAHLGPEGDSLKVFIVRAETAATAHDFQGALRNLEEGRQFVEERNQSGAAEAVESLALAVQIALDLGTPVGPEDSLYTELNGALGRGDVSDVVGAHDRVQSALAAASDRLLTGVQGRITTAQGLKIDVDEMSDFWRRARMALGVQHYLEGLRLLKESNDRAGRATAQHRQAYTVLSSAAAAVAEAKKRNVDVTKVIEILVDAKKAFERLDYERTASLAGQAKAETEKLTVLYTAAQRILAVKDRMDLATKLGIDAPHLRDLASKAKEAMKAKEYGKAVDLATRSEQEFAEMIRDKVGDLLAGCESLLGSVEGVNLATVNDELIRARQALDASDFGPAADLALHLQEQLGKLKRQSEEAEGVIRHLREVIADAEAMNLEVPSTAAVLEKAERAYKMGNFEEALDHASHADAELVQERDRGIADMMRRFEDSIERAKKEGTDTRSAERLFERSREFFRAKKYRQALATALQSEAEAERVALQQIMARQAVETIARKLKTLGRPAPSVDRLADEAQAAYGSGDFVKALDTAIRASDALADFRLAFEETQEVRTRAEALRHTAREIGAEADHLDGYVQDGDRALEAGEMASAQAAYAQTLEWGLGLVRSHLKELLRQAEEMAATCRKLEVDPMPVLNRLSEARSRLDSEDFLGAFGQIQEGRDAAHTALGARLNRALSEAADNVAHAKKLGTDAGNAEALLQEANERIARGEYEGALEVAGRAMERVESVKVVEKRFVELTYKAETTVRNGKRFGIDMRAAEARLAEAMQLRTKDLSEAIKAAEDAYRIGWDAVEAFAPNLKGNLTMGPAQLDTWTDASIELENVGKGLAKDVRLKVLGDAETEGLQELAAVRARGKESLAFRIKMTAPGSVPLAIQIVSHRVLDDKEYVQEMIVQIEVAQSAAEKPKRIVADLETRCPICKGVIKKGFKVLQCACGRDFHELCASRVGRCPVCFRPLGGAAE